MDKQIAVALSGSGFKLPALVGAVSAIVDMGYTITEIAGTSGGSIIAGLYATGMSVSTMKELAFSTDFVELMPWRIWGFWNGLSNSDNLFKWLQDHTGHVTCGETIIPYKAIASNLSLEIPFVFSTETTPAMEVALASVCSASIPVIYQKRVVNNFTLCDGGVVNNIPVSHLSKGTKRIGIALYSSPMDMSSMSLTQYLGRVIDTMLQANEKTHIYLAKEENATIIPVNTFGISMLDRKMTLADRTKLYESGYQSVQKELSYDL